MWKRARDLVTRFAATTWRIWRSVDDAMERRVVSVSVWLAHRDVSKTQQHVWLAAAGVILALALAAMTDSAFFRVCLFAFAVCEVLVADHNYRRDRVADEGGALSRNDHPIEAARVLQTVLLIYSMQCAVTSSEPVRIIAPFVAWQGSMWLSEYLKLAPRFPPPRQVRQAAPLRTATAGA